MIKVNQYDYNEFKNDINICICSDDNYCKYAYILLSSLYSLKHNKKINIFLITINFSEKNKFIIHNRFSDKMRIEFIDGSQYFFQKYNTSKRLNESAYLRFLIFDCMKSFEKILYLDADTLVINNLEQIYSIDISNNFLAAARDYGIISAYKHKNSIYYFHCKFFLKMKNIYNYFNSGVLLLNPKKISNNFNSITLLNEAKKRKYLFQDQDILNVFFHENVLLINNCWNFFVNKNDGNDIKYEDLPNIFYNDYKNAKTSPNILHFTNSSFPIFNLNSDYSDKWWKFATNSPFFDEFKNIQEKNLNEIQITKNNNLLTTIVEIIISKFNKKIFFNFYKEYKETDKYLFIKFLFYKRYVRSIIKR